MIAELVLEELDYKSWNVALLEKVLEVNNIDFDVNDLDYEHDENISTLKNELQYKNWCVSMLECVIKAHDIRYDVEDSIYHEIEYQTYDYDEESNELIENTNTFEVQGNNELEADETLIGIRCDLADRATRINMSDLIKQLNIA